MNLLPVPLGTLRGEQADIRQACFAILLRQAPVLLAVSPTAFASPNARQYLLDCVWANPGDDGMPLLDRLRFRSRIRRAVLLVAVGLVDSTS